MTNEIMDVETTTTVVVVSKTFRNDDDGRRRFQNFQPENDDVMVDVSKKLDPEASYFVVR